MPDAEASWRELAAKALGRTVDSATSKTVEGVDIRPLYPRRTEDAPALRPGPWAVAQRVDHPDPEQANRLALLDLEGGADSLVLVGDRSPYARGFGIGTKDLDLVLADVELDFISLRLDAGSGTIDLLSNLCALVDARHLQSAALAVDIGFDPIGWGGRLGTSIDDAPGAILDLRSEAGLGGTTFLADGRPWHESGAGEVQELAAVLATGVAYLRVQEAHGLALDEARDNIGFLLAADADSLLGLSKFRALRRLWARVETASGLEPRPARVHAETSWRVMTRYDPWTNVMRATAATFAAGLGGADVVSVLPFTLPLGLPDDGARRLARNLQRVLLDEAHLAKVEDPAAGAGGFEALTEQLCRDAWRLFQEIEREGGILRATSRLKGMIAETAHARAQNIAHLSHGIVGTSRFASLDGSGLKALDVKPRAVPDVGPDALPAQRDAEPFETLRDRAEALAADGTRPRVFLATLGKPAAFGPRAADAANFFAAAGMVADVGLEMLDTAALVAAFRESGAKIACLCGTDAAYAESSAASATALRDAGARRVLLIGAARSPEGSVSNIDAVIHDGYDVLALLTHTLDAAL